MVTIDAALGDPEAFRGRIVILGNELQRTSYTIETAEVTDGQTRLGFGDLLCSIGMGAVAATDNERATVTSDRNLAGYGRVDGGMHAGRWLYNEDRSKGFRIAAVAGRGFSLEGVKGDLDGRRLYWISEIGPGDTYRIPTATSYTR
jgi:hypothetical protein